MIKCPQCLRPRDGSSDPCPHCGEVPYGVRFRPAQAAAEQAAAQEGDGERPRRLGFGGAEIDLGEVSTAGLDLAGDDYLPPPLEGTAPGRPPADTVKSKPPRPRAPDSLGPAPAAPPPALRPVAAAAAEAPINLEENEVRRIAAFGEPAPGAPGAIGYFLRVARRRRSLGRSRAVAAASVAAIRVRRIAALAALGRAAQDGHKGAEPRSRLVEEARAADARRDGEAQRSAEIETEHRARADGLRRRLEALRAELRPLEDAEAEAKRALADLKTDAKRAEAALKRADIERRNVAELIAKRQESYGDLSLPAEERGRLLAEISQLDRRSPELNERADAARAKLDGFAAPIAAADAALVEAARRAAEKRAEAEAARAEVEDAEEALEDAVEASGARLDAGRREADEAWAEVGESLLAGIDRGGPLGARAQEAEEHVESFRTASRELALVERAAASYDRDAYARGRTLAALIAAGVVAAIAILLFCVSCGAALAAGDAHDTVGQTIPAGRGWRLEAAHVGEWIPIPEPGKVTVVDFWSSSCAPCLAALPELERLWQGVDRRRIQVVGVSIDEDAAAARRALEERVGTPITFPMVLDGKAAKLQGAFRVGGAVPSTFVVDRGGAVRLYADGSSGDVDRVAAAARALAR